MTLDIIMNVSRSSSRVPIITVGFRRNLNFLDRFKKKASSNVKFHENPSSGNRVVAYEQTQLTDGR